MRTFSVRYPRSLITYIHSVFLSEAQMENWLAMCYAHYILPPNILVDSNGVVKYQFVCAKYVILPSLSICILTSHIRRRPYIKLTHLRSVRNAISLEIVAEVIN